MITKLNSLILILNFLVLFASSISLLPAKAQSSGNTHRNTYHCVEYQGKPTTFVQTERGVIKLITWESNYFSDSGWTPQKRCDEVTGKLQFFSDNGTLRYVTTDKVTSDTGEKYNVICVSSQRLLPGEKKKIECDENGLLITLEPQDDPKTVMENLFGDEIKKDPTKRGQNKVDIEKHLNQLPVIDDESCPPILCD